MLRELIGETVGLVLYGLKYFLLVGFLISIMSIILVLVLHA